MHGNVKIKLLESGLNVAYSGLKILCCISKMKEVSLLSLYKCLHCLHRVIEFVQIGTWIRSKNKIDC